MINIGITIEELEEIDNKNLKKKIKGKEKENWKSRMQEKPRLVWNYRGIIEGH